MDIADEAKRHVRGCHDGKATHASKFAQGSPPQIAGGQLSAHRQDGLSFGRVR